ncbi:MAG: PAS domain S-box protein, partial [candidate division Zixibacteria bacterium]|nr:PAS domain S-box protein [candidate division Zixibacteria bacterium]
REAADALQRQFDFQQIVTDISKGFVQTTSDQIDEVIDRALAAIGQFMGVDRSYVFLYAPDGSTMTNTHEWCAEGINTQVHELQQIPMATFPWTLRPIRAGNVLYVPRVCEVPDSAAMERAVFESGCIQSLICVPLASRDEIIGFVGFDSVGQEKTWSEDDTTLLHIVGDVVASAIDRKNTMLALHESEQKWRVLAENSADHIMIIDPELRLQFINRTLSDLTIDDVIGRSILDFLDGADADNAKRCYLRVLETGRPEPYRCQLRQPDGSVREFHARVGAIKRDGATIALSISATDITDTVKTREALEESETRLRQMAEHLESVLWIDDLETGEILYVSPSFERVFGLSCEDVYVHPRAWAERIHPEDRDWVEEIVDGANDAGSFDIEYRLLMPDKSIRWIHARTFPVYDDDGRLYRMAGIAEDITERRRVEDELSRARRLESAGQVAGQIAHDFNNLLAPMVAYPDLIRNRIDAPKSVRSMLNDLEDAARQMADINQQLLTLGRRGHYKVVPVDLNALTEQVIRTLDLPESVELIREFGTDLPSPVVGRAQLARVLANLIRNAAEATDGQGTLTFRTGLCAPDSQPPEWENGPDADCIVWSITDTGHGISPEALDHIFDPYFSTKKSDNRRGSGLGLAVAHSVVRDHNGHLTVESRDGEGSTFSVYLPLPKNVTVVTSEAGPTPIGEGQHILVVDDDVIQQRVARTILEDLGYRVTVTSSGTDALELVLVNSYDLVLLDMVMPDIDGAETLRRIQRINPRQAAVVLSGYAPGDRVQAAMDLGAHQFVSKPVGKYELAEAVHRAIDAAKTTATVS